MLSYEDNEKAFFDYIEECREKILQLCSLTMEDKKDLAKLREEQKIEGNESDLDIIKINRLNMIDKKVNHTMRVLSDAVKSSEKLGFNIDFQKVLKISALLHDIGRFDQATWYNSFSEQGYKIQMPGIENHAQAGYYILFDQGKIEDFRIGKKYRNVIGNAVLHHGDSILSGDLSYRIDRNIIKIDVEKLLSDVSSLNEGEKIVSAAVVQLIRDVDMLDILYQHLNGEMPVTRSDLRYKKGKDTVKMVANHFGISEKEILDWNGLTEEIADEQDSLRVPLNNVEPIKIAVPNDIQQKFFSKQPLDLKEIMARKDWNFITGMWYRLGHFLQNINFTSTLMGIDESNLMDQIYAAYPEKYKPLVKPAFDFAKEELIANTIDKNKDEIYIKR